LDENLGFLLGKRIFFLGDFINFKNHILEIGFIAVLVHDEVGVGQLENLVLQECFVLVEELR
jgi:hypothetical protein